MEAIVLVGGLGTRLGVLTEKTPKPMLPVGSRPFLEIILDYWEAQGISRFVLATGYLSKMIQNHFGARFKRAELVYSIEEKPLGTGGALYLAQEKLKSKHPFLAVNGDTFFEVNLRDLKQFHAAKQAECSIALFQTLAKDRYEGVEMNEEGRIQLFLGRLSQEVRHFVSGGVYLMNHGWTKDLVNRRNEKISVEAEIFPEMIKQNKHFYGFVSSGRFIDIGIPSDYERAQNFLMKAAG